MSRSRVTRRDFCRTASERQPHFLFPAITTMDPNIAAGSTEALVYPPILGCHSAGGENVENRAYMHTTIPDGDVSQVTKVCTVLLVCACMWISTCVYPGYLCGAYDHSRRTQGFRRHCIKGTANPACDLQALCYLSTFSGRPLLLNKPGSRWSAVLQGSRAVPPVRHHSPRFLCGPSCGRHAIRS